MKRETASGRPPGWAVNGTSIFELRGMAGILPSLRAGARELGFVHIEDALTNELMDGLRAEASAQKAVARPARGTLANPYSSHIAELGDFAGSFLADSSVIRLLQAVFEQPLALSKLASCYTYYEPDSFLSRHRDRPAECAVTLIVYLDAESPDPQSLQTGLALRIFGQGDAGTSEPSAVIPTRTGTLVVGRGSSFWHERPRLQPGERVVALTACFSAGPDPRGP
jgi:hypothetical protein